MIKTAIYVLSALTLILGGVAAALWLAPAPDGDMGQSTGFGLYEDRELVRKTDPQGRTHYVVKDGNGHKLFHIPVRDCLLDTRFRDGRLRFRENATGRTGHIDKDGMVAFDSPEVPASPEQSQRERTEIAPAANEQKADKTPAPGHAPATPSYKLDDNALRQLHADNPFYKEADRILSGKLDVDDAERRRVILNYCEHFRTAYTTKDLDFLRQIFSEKALIIVGNVVKTAPEQEGFTAGQRVEYYLRTKGEYLDRLSRAFSASRKINVKFSDFRILRHPTMDGIYGVSLRQRYSSDQYSDDGWLFLLWDFRNEAMPLVHVRTWQPATEIHHADEIINMSDFNLK